MTQQDSTALALFPMEDPLELKIKRAVLPSYALYAIHRRKHKAPFGRYVMNWMGGGKFSEMLAQVFFGQEPEFKAARKALRAIDCNFKPRRLALDVLRCLEKSYPTRLNREEIRAALQRQGQDISATDINTALEYLQQFTVEVTGTSVLPDMEGGWGIADVDLYLTYRNRINQLKVALDKRLEKHGDDAFRALPNVRVTQSFPSIQPVLLEITLGVANASD